jgi:hypothetical protein
MLAQIAVHGTFIAPGPVLHLRYLASFQALDGARRGTHR